MSEKCNKIEQKACKGTKFVPLSQKIQWRCYGIGLPCVGLCGILWSYMALYDLMWSCMIFLYGLVLFNTYYGSISPFLAVKDPNSFGLVNLVKRFFRLPKEEL